eukprot:6192038-Pleurochrysis_carterae.AAC.3
MTTHRGQGRVPPVGGFPRVKCALDGCRVLAITRVLLPAEYALLPPASCAPTKEFVLADTPRYLSLYRS